MRWGSACLLLCAGCFGSSGSGWLGEGPDGSAAMLDGDASAQHEQADAASADAAAADGAVAVTDASTPADASTPSDASTALDARAALDAAAVTDAGPDGGDADANDGGACSCFSTGQWSLDNLSPCIFLGSSRIYLYSSWLDETGAIQCGGPYPDNVMPPRPAEPWSASSFWVDCTGQFELCFTIKAGDVDAPSPDDCVIVTECVDVDYTLVNASQRLPELPSWSSPNSTCAAEFYTAGGYGEMTVQGTSDACGPVDDGMGNPRVFHRTNFCAPTCLDTPDTPACMGCRTGGSGSF